MKVTENGAHPSVCGALKLAVGAVVMATVWVLVTVPQAFVALSITVYVPSFAYVCVGLVSVLASPSPKFQEYDVALEELLVNVTVVPLVELLKFAVGVVLIVI